MSAPEENGADPTDQEYLRDLAERLRHVPAVYGVDGYDIDRLSHIARHGLGPRHPNGAPVWAPDGTLLDDRGNRSVFDDVDK